MDHDLEPFVVIPKLKPSDAKAAMFSHFAAAGYVPLRTPDHVLREQARDGQRGEEGYQTALIVKAGAPPALLVTWSWRSDDSVEWVLEVCDRYKSGCDVEPPGAISAPPLREPAAPSASSVPGAPASAETASAPKVAPPPGSSKPSRPASGRGKSPKVHKPAAPAAPSAEAPFPFE